MNIRTALLMSLCTALVVTLSGCFCRCKKSACVKSITTEEASAASQRSIKRSVKELADVPASAEENVSEEKSVSSEDFIVVNPAQEEAIELNEIQEANEIIEDTSIEIVEIQNESKSE